MGKCKGVVADRCQGMKIEIYDMTQDESEQTDLAAQHPEVIDEIRKAMLEAHVPSPFWDKDNKPLFSAKAACEATGVEHVIPAKK